jgi:hypothetical protein
LGASRRGVCALSRGGWGNRGGERREGERDRITNRGKGDVLLYPGVGDERVDHEIAVRRI